MRKKLLMIIGALLLLCSLPLSGTFATSTKQFSDVPPSKHFAEAVYDLAERNIIGGYPDGTFKPGNSITRGQAAAIIAKLIKLDTSKLKDPGFKDVPKANGYYKAIAAMAEKASSAAMEMDVLVRTIPSHGRRWLRFLSKRSICRAITSIHIKVHSKMYTEE